MDYKFSFIVKDLWHHYFLSILNLDNEGLANQVLDSKANPVRPEAFWCDFNNRNMLFFVDFILKKSNAFNEMSVETICGFSGL